MRAKLTNQFIRSVESPAVGQTVIRDTEVKGLLVKIGASARTFFVEHRVKGSGKKRLPKIGSFPEWTTELARTEAKRLIVEMDKGNDPLAEARKAKESTGSFNPDTFTVFDALDYYIKQLRTEGKSEVTIDHIERETKRLLKPWAKRPLLSIKKRECKAMHAAIRETIRASAGESLTDTTGHYGANRTLRYFRSAFNAVAYDFDDDGFPEDAVCPIRKGFKWHDEQARDVRLEWSDLHGWWEATSKLDSPIRRDAWRMILLTGLRNSDTCSIAWDDVDFENGTLHRPEPKGGKRKSFTVPLSNAAIAILKQRQADNAKDFGGSDGGFVFPTQGKDGVTHIDTLKEQVVKDGKKHRNIAIGCAHDLRRTFISAGFEKGVSEIALKVLANHSLPKRPSDMTKRYIVPDVEFLRGQTQSITDFLLGHARVTLVEGAFKQEPKPKDKPSLKPAA